MKKLGFAAVMSILVVAGGCEQPAPPVQWHPMGHHQMAPAGTENATYLGVQVAPVMGALREQLGLPMGMGLVVEWVAPDSPAAAARLARYDVLTRFNEQHLVNPEQLMVLVRDSKPGQEVKLGVIRHAMQATIPVKLASHEMPRFTPEMFPGRGMMGPGMGHGMPGGPMSPGMRNPGMPGGPMGPGMRGPGMPGQQDWPEGREGKFQGERNPGGGLTYTLPGVMPPRPGGKGPGEAESKITVRIQEDGRRIIAFEDNEYALTVTVDKGGNKTLVARNLKENKTVFEGPINTPEQRAKLPPPVARRMERLGDRMRINAQPGRPGNNAPPGRPGKGTRTAAEEQEYD